MFAIIFISAVGIPLILALTATMLPKLKVLYDGMAVACAYIFGIISAFKIYEVIRDHAVLMTNIHAIFNNVAFLITGAYLGNYALYRLLLRMLRNWKKNGR